MPLRILLAEDNLVNQKLASRLLENQGHLVVVAADGAQALDTLEKQSFDLVLMDAQMPVMDGFEATAAIRRLEEKTRAHIPIIAMTAHAMVGDRQRCLEAGHGRLSSPSRFTRTSYSKPSKRCSARSPSIVNSSRLIAAAAALL